jgi:hypothetical protein
MPAGNWQVRCYNCNGVKSVWPYAAAPPAGTPIKKHGNPHDSQTAAPPANSPEGFVPTNRVNCTICVDNAFIIVSARGESWV